jgi:Spy/CpxP family protein refolding chaperone
MKKKILLSVLLLSLALNVAVFLTMGFHWFSWKHHPGSTGRDAHFSRMVKTLKMDTAQAKAMQQDRQALEQELQPLREAHRRKKMEMFALMKSTGTYTPQIDSLIEQSAGIQMNIEKTCVRHSFHTRTILTPEQQKKFETMLEKGFRRAHPGRWQGRHAPKNDQNPAPQPDPDAPPVD